MSCVSLSLTLITKWIRRSRRRSRLQPPSTITDRAVLDNYYTAPRSLTASTGTLLFTAIGHSPTPETNPKTGRGKRGGAPGFRPPPLKLLMRRPPLLPPGQQDVAPLLRSGSSSPLRPEQQIELDLLATGRHPSAPMSSGSQSSGTLSSDAESKKTTTIPYIIHKGSIHPDTGVGTLYLEMPLSETIVVPKNLPQMRLEVRDDDEVDCLRRMKLLEHENILAVHFYEKDQDGGVRAFVEPYTGYISDLFTNPKFFVNLETGVIPSQPFQEIVSVSISALEYIFKNDLYHGNFSWHTTVYRQEKDGSKIVKLSNFEKKNKSPLECKIGDCHGLAHCLEKVSEHVRVYYPDFRPETCCLIDDLARRLRATTTIQSLCTMKQDNEDHAFFWDYKRKQTFCAYDIPKAWGKPAFLQSFLRSPSAPALPWDTKWSSDEYMEEMESYRKANGIKEYNFLDTMDFIRFISGLYTHHEELEEKGLVRTVDAAVHAKHPRILLDLKMATESDDMDVD